MRSPHCTVCFQPRMLYNLMWDRATRGGAGGVCLHQSHSAGTWQCPPASPFTCLEKYCSCHTEQRCGRGHQGTAAAFPAFGHPSHLSWSHSHPEQLLNITLHQSAACWAPLVLQDLAFYQEEAASAPPAPQPWMLFLLVFFPLFGSLGILLSLCLAPVYRKGLQLSNTEHFSLLCLVRCIFHMLSFPAGRGLETLRAVEYCLSPSLFVCLLVVRFFGLSFLLDFFFRFQIACVRESQTPVRDNRGLSIDKWFHSCI